MRIAVLGSPESWYVKDLCRAAGQAHQVVPVTFGDLASAVGRGATTAEAGDFDLADADCVLVRGMRPGSLEQIVFRMDVLAAIQTAGVPVVNPPRAIEAAVDKYLATVRLRAAGLVVPETFVCQRAGDALAGFERLGGDVVLKPLFGSEGRGITRISDGALAGRAFHTLQQLSAVVYLQKYVPNEGFDYRLLVIGDRVLGIRRRCGEDWRTNVTRGATAEPLDVTPELSETALAAAAAVGAPLAGVDLLPGTDGVLYAIEVNSAPGWQALAAALDTDVAALVLDYLSRTAEKPFAGAE